jgi:hypothetical protein
MTTPAASCVLARATSPSWISPTGTHVHSTSDIPSEATAWRIIEPLGKNHTGRLLDGTEWNQYPASLKTEL